MRRWLYDAEAVALGALSLAGALSVAVYVRIRDGLVRTRQDQGAK